ncbi:MAG: hypothetical protein V8S98_01870 [Lachnospiraceae bacterium]
MGLIGGDIAFRCNFATVDNQGLISDRRAGRIRLGTDELAAALNGLMIDGIQVLLKKPLNTVQCWYFVAPAFLPRFPTQTLKRKVSPSKKRFPKTISRKPHLPPTY